MAQTRERTRPEAKSPPQTTQRTSAPTSSTPPGSPGPKRGWLERFRTPLTDAPSADGKPRRRSGGAIFKSFFGILIWFVASQFIMYGLLLLDSALTKPGERPPLETLHLLPPNTPLLGWITPFLLLYGGAVIGLWVLLIRFNLIPRDFFGARAQAEARARRQAGGSTTATGATTGPRKTRAQRRHVEAQARTQAETKGGKSSASAKSPVKSTAKANDTKNGASVSSGNHDEEYERVREAERLRRRRQAKR